jgi:hypothetical protein
MCITTMEPIYKCDTFFPLMHMTAAVWNALIISQY